MTLETRARLRWNAALFDLDGTLVDTSEGVLAALGSAFAEVSGHDVETNKVDLSLSLDEMINTIDPMLSPVVRKNLSAAFRRHYDSSSWQLAHTYPGAEECLRDLVAAGLRVFVVTNKRSAAAARVLEHFQLARYLEGVVGQADTGQPVPKAELARRCLTSSGLDPATTVVVGDSNQDASMAASWEMTFIGVTSGAGPLSHVMDDEKQVQLVRLADVTSFVLGRRGGNREP